MIDVDAALAKGGSHMALPALVISAWKPVNVQAAIPDGDTGGIVSEFEQTEALTVEAVQVLVDAQHGRVNDLAMQLTSPAGIRSLLLIPRTALIAEKYGLNQQRLLSVHCYGEQAQGKWRLRVVDTNAGEYVHALRQGTTVSRQKLPNSTGRLKS
ncbi:hypothetical protein CEK28_14775 [Xenophilus sp. AP218F]|nr:hypothetical protein CEK28_14775 [Xenophilus sp. AP218F]